jgi:signal transduction histidine kinase
LLGNPGKMEIKADQARARTALQNVVENALKYSTSQKKPVEISLEKEDGGFQVTVQDFGVGIPPEEQERVFEPFYRVDKSRTKETGGYGLGLSLCREIMRAHGGEISLESSAEKGTRVFLFFPSEKVS